MLFPAPKGAAAWHFLFPTPAALFPISIATISDLDRASAFRKDSQISEIRSDFHAACGFIHEPPDVIILHQRGFCLLSDLTGSVQIPMGFC